MLRGPGIYCRDLLKCQPLSVDSRAQGHCWVPTPTEDTGRVRPDVLPEPPGTHPLPHAGWRRVPPRMSQVGRDSEMGQCSSHKEQNPHEHPSPRGKHQSAIYQRVCRGRKKIMSTIHHFWNGNAPKVFSACKNNGRKAGLTKLSCARDVPGSER